MIRFFECERRCDEDPCCRGIGYVQDTGASGMSMLQLLQCVLSRAINAYSVLIMDRLQLDLYLFFSFSFLAQIFSV